MQLSELIKSRIDLYGLSFGLGKKCRKRVNRKASRVGKTNHKVAFGQVKPQQALPKWSKGRRKTRQSNKTKAHPKKMKRKVKRKTTKRQRK